MSAIGKIRTSSGARTVAAALLVGGMLTYAGVAGAAAEDQTITAEGNAQEGQWVPSTATVQTGEKVTWSFAGAGHNIVSTNESATDPRWAGYVYPGPGEYDAAPVGASGSFTFYKSGSYAFVCLLHPNMTGTVTVEGTDQDIPVETPTPTPTATPTATATPSGTPPPPPVDDHTQTPAPGGSANTDKTAPVVSGISLKAARKGANVSLKLSESATVTLRFKLRGSGKLLRTVTLQARAGTRTFKVRSAKLKRGHYRVEIQARDAMGNRSTLKRANVRIRR